MTILDWILGRDTERARREAEAKAEMAREGPQEAAQEHVQIPPKQPAPAPKPEIRPAVRMMPHEADLMRQAHERKPEPAQKKPEQAQEASRMANTVTPQPPPSLGGPGIPFVNPRVQQPRRSVSDELLAEARAEVAKEKAAMTPDQKLEHDHPQKEADKSQDRRRER